MTMLLRLFPLLAITFVDIVGFSLLFPLLPYYAEHFGASPHLIGSMITLSSICGLVSAPLFGALSDRVGRRMVLLLTQIATASSYIMLARADTLPVFFVARVIEGFSIGGLSITQAYVADVTSIEERGQAYAYLAMAYGCAGVVGPMICALLLPLGAAVPFSVAAAVAITTILLTLAFIRESYTTQIAAVPFMQSIKRATGSARLRRVLLMQLCFMLGYAMWFSTLGLIVERILQFHANQASWLYALSAVVGISVQGFFVSRLLRRYGAATVLRYGLLSCIVAFACIAVLSSAAQLILLVLFWSLGNAVVRPTMNMLLADCAPENERGIYLSFGNAILNIAFCLGPLLAVSVITWNVRYIGLIPVLLSVTAISKIPRNFAARE